MIHAVVAGLGLNGLGVVRALAGAGVPVIVLDTDFNSPEARTRFGMKRRVSSLSGDAFIEALVALRGELQSDPVLLLTQEGSVETVAAAQHVLAPQYRLTVPEPDIAHGALRDKNRFQRLAEQHGFAIPRALRLHRSDGSQPSLDGLRFPCVLKPVQKTPEYERRFVKAYKVESVEEASKLWSSMREFIEEAILQEWIEGGDSGLYSACSTVPRARDGAFPSRAGKCASGLRWWAGRRAGVPAPDVADELVRITDAFFNRVGLYGLASMEFKRDARDGKFYMVEPTVGRTDYQEEIASLNGVNIPYAAYCDSLDIAMPPGIPSARQRGWRDPIGYARAIAARAPDLAVNMWMSDAYFRVNDPMPYLALKSLPVTRRLAALRRSSR